LLYFTNFFTQFLQSDFYFISRGPGQSYNILL